MMSEEAHVIGSMHCGQVSMHLKKARSLVRIAEIQSTVQEQRYLIKITKNDCVYMCIFYIVFFIPSFIS